MYPWNILAISPSHDKKDIKRAYAKKLKTTRPDEDSYAFQELHRAYKDALHLANNPHCFHNNSSDDLAQILIAEAEATSNEPNGNKDPTQAESALSILKVEEVASPDTPNHVEEQSSNHLQAPLQNIVTIDDNPIAQIEDNGSSDADEFEQKQEAVKQFIAKTQSIIQSNQTLNNQDTWQFLLDSPFILEGGFNWQVGLAIFKCIAEHNVHSSKANLDNIQQFELNTLIFFDSVFSWHHNQEYLYETFDDELCDTILISIANYQHTDNPISGLKGGTVVKKEKFKTKKNTGLPKEYYFGNLLIRSLALIIDFIVIAFPIYLLMSSPLIRELFEVTEDATFLAILCAIPLYFLMALFLESSQWQATPGKRLLGLRVMNKNFEKIGFHHNVLRIICFFVTVPFGKILWIINCFLGGNLIHDRLSRSFVINIRKT